MTAYGGALVVDTSAVVAILTGEPGAEWLTGALESASERLRSAATVVEAGMVTGRHPASLNYGDCLLADTLDGDVRVTPGEHVRWA